MSATVHTPEAELLVRAQTGDLGAAEEIWRLHQDALLAYARRLTRNEPDADDLVQDVGLRFLSALRRHQGPTSEARPYLFRAVRNAFVSSLRVSARSAATDAAVLDSLAPPHVENFDRTADAELVHAALLRLSSRDRAAIVMLEVDGRSRDAVAQALGLTPNAVSVLRSRARENLRTAYLQECVVRTEGTEEHPTEELALYVRGRLSDKRTARLEGHLARCPVCVDQVATLRDMDSRLPAVLWLAVPAVLDGLGATAPLPDDDPTAWQDTHARITILVRRRWPLVVVGLVLLAALVGAFSLRGDDSPPGSTDPTVPPTSSPPGATPTGSAAPEPEPSAPGSAPGSPVPGGPPPGDAPSSGTTAPATSPVPAVVLPPGVTEPADPSESGALVGWVTAEPGGDGGLMRFLVRNATTSPSGPVTIDLAVPSGATLDSSQVPSWCEPGPGRLVCTIDDLVPDSARGATIGYEGTGDGPFTLRITTADGRAAEGSSG